MIPFRTPVIPALTSNFVKAGYEHKILTLGSCFAQNIGDKLKGVKLDALVNPGGVIFNPFSVYRILSFALEEKVFSNTDLEDFNEKWFNFNFHSSFAANSEEACLANINTSIKNCSTYLRSSKLLILTFGSAWVYERVENNEIVANCYKIPSKNFKKKFLDIDFLTKCFLELFLKIKEKNSDLQVLITVSPVRHWKDGATDNQRSKSLLILLAHRLKENLNFVEYFPAYEIMMDELRDYRFYKEDMLHPSELAINYIWQRFTTVCLNAASLKVMPLIEAIAKAINHLPFDRNTKEFKQFVAASKTKIEALQHTMPQLNFDAELAHFNQFDL